MDLRFADDVVLFAQSKADIRKMLLHLAVCSKKYGLTINFEKTNVLTLDALEQRQRTVNVGEHAVSILGEDKSEKYLGIKLCLGEMHEI